MTKLFTVEQVKKFFNILDKLSGSIPVDRSKYPWENYKTIYTDASNHTPCTREVFVHRTINKWLKGKYLIIYRTSDLGVVYKQFVSITRINYQNDWGFGYLDVGMIDYIKPYGSSLFGGEKIKHNDALKLEGEWCKNPNVHHKLLEFNSMKDVPDKEYVFKTYDFSKYPRRNKKGVDPKDLITTTKSFIAKTEQQAYKAKRTFEDEHKGELYISDLIDVKILTNEN